MGRRPKTNAVLGPEGLYTWRMLAAGRSVAQLYNLTIVGSKAWV